MSFSTTLTVQRYYLLSLVVVVVFCSSSDRDTCEGTFASKTFKIAGIESDDVIKIRAILLLPNSENKAARSKNIYFTLREVIPVVEMALQEVARLNLAKPVTFNFDYVDSKYIDSVALMTVVCRYRLWPNIDVIFGPVDTYAISKIASVSYMMNSGVPVITSAALPEGFKSKEPDVGYPLLVRSHDDYTSAARVFLALYVEHEWKDSFAVLYFDNPDTHAGGQTAFSFTADATRRLFGNDQKIENAVQIFTSAHYDAVKPFRKITTPNITKTVAKEVLKDLSLFSNVILLCASPEAIREIMLAAFDLGMAKSGEYVFFNIDVLSGTKPPLQPWKVKGDLRNDDARIAYRALKTISIKQPNSTKYKEFEQKVEKTYRDTNLPNTTKVNSFISAFYDGILLYALALNETIAKGDDIHNGTLVTRNMWNRNFTGITGQVTIDEQGDRYSDYTLYALNPYTDNLEPVVDFYGAKKQLVPVSGDDIKKVNWYWVGGHHPPDSPICGYDRKLCPDKSLPMYVYVIVGFLILLLVFGVISFLMYRRYKQETELAAMNWRIPWDELDVHERRKNRQKAIEENHVNNVNDETMTLPPDELHMYPLKRRMSQLSLVSEETVALHHLNQIFTSTTKFKGTTVALKGLRIEKAKIDLTRSMLIELKKMKDMSHEHIARFFGACIEFPNYCLVTEYCQKGSLQDILENDDVKLDKMMRYSLLHDAVKGLDYLHGNPDVRSHGNLKSSNCVVDSRFVLKLTDFGLHSVHDLEINIYDPESHANFRRFFWTAPELLRNERLTPGGTQKGDVYSLGIIIHELAFREGPFYLQNDEADPQEIIERVKSMREEPPFRPTVRENLHSEDDGDEELIKMMTGCWVENPHLRPDAYTIRKECRRLNRANESSNIVDNLLKRLEQYAGNLEVLVEERTRSYLEEKQKTEDLLYAMLPKPVAEQLIRGESVQPEWYDSVTIYFSDIVGFTSMSSCSTPMQVVDFLNDLYTAFDSTITNFDVYKVETIGDAYMLVSGLPVVNVHDKNAHALEIARSSLALLKLIDSFKIRHRKDDKLKLRIGMHSGPVAAGVVGLKMPRYCLFGDTVNTCSRMESNGEALKIHVSSTTKAVLDTYNRFILEERGLIEMKGKGKQLTYWLLGEHQDMPLPPPIVTPVAKTAPVNFGPNSPGALNNHNS